jgi:hypothetical protein
VALNFVHSALRACMTAILSLRADRQTINSTKSAVA